MSDYTRAQLNVQRVVNTRGSVINFISPSNAGKVVRDDYGSIVSQGTKQIIPIKAFPITPATSPRELERGGIKDQVDIIAYTSWLDWQDLLIPISQIDSKQNRVEYNARKYVVTTAVEFSQFGVSAGNDFLYIFKILQ